jgi:hypothetical protein
MSESDDPDLPEQITPALNEFMSSVAKVNDGLSKVTASALRMQMLVLEDAQNMLAEFGAAIKAAERNQEDGGGE